MEPALKKIFSSVLAIGTLFSIALPIKAESLDSLNTQLNGAICAQDWGLAVRTIDRLMAINTSDNYRNYLESAQIQIAQLQQTGSYFPDGIDCSGRITTEDWELALVSLGASPDRLTSTPTQPTRRELPTAPMAGYNCSDFATQQEAQYHLEHGTAPVDLDDDFDGEACEYLTSERGRGRTILNNQATSGFGYELLGRGNAEWFLRVRNEREGWDFTTRSFDSSDAAIEHFNCYYNDACRLPVPFSIGRTR